MAESLSPVNFCVKGAKKVVVSRVRDVWKGAKKMVFGRVR